MSENDNMGDSRERKSEADDRQLAAATAIAEHAGQEIATNFRQLAPRQRRTVLTSFRRQLFPAARPGRKHSKEITAAVADWMAGIRGLPLYRKHIPRYDKMGRWQRKVKTRALLDAIRNRRRHERRKRASGGTADHASQ
ncbi:MAG TPA: hypothetical protein VMG40_09010 [Bryobacteraceae bacterium]|nr:hypothetical protein [Bryobacteraceae bacterium]